MIIARPLTARPLTARPLTALRLGETVDVPNYLAAGKSPELVADYYREYYRADSANTDFDTLMDHAATSLRTMVDSDGVLKWGPHNLLTYSEDFTNAAWTKGRSVVSADLVGPDGNTNSAYTLSDNAAGGTDNVNIRFSVPVSTTTTYKFSVFLKAIQTTKVRVGGDNFTTPANGGTLFDLSGGTVISNRAGYSGEIESVGNGWYLCSTTFTTDAADTEGLVAIYLADGSGGFTLPLDGSNSVGIYGAHLYRSDLGGMVNNPATGNSYVPTTDSAVYLPRVGHHRYEGGKWVNKGLLIESEARTNLITYSEDFSDASWTKSNCTVTANDATAPDGNDTADLLTATAANATAKAAVTTTADPFTFSLYLKRKTGTGDVDITMDGTTWATQTISDTVWTRVYVAQTGVAGTSNPGIRLVTSGDEVWAWGGQAE